MLSSATASYDFFTAEVYSSITLFDLFPYNMTLGKSDPKNVLECMVLNGDFISKGLL